MGNSSVLAYLNAVNKIIPLSKDEEQKLILEYRATKNPALAKRLVNNHLRLVVKIVYEYQRPGSPAISDLIQEGNCGLIKAIDKFDSNKNVPLGYYCAQWIRAYVLKYLVKNYRLVKIGTTEAQRKLFFNLSKETARLMSQSEVEPSDADLAHSLSVPEKDVKEMRLRLSANSESNLEPTPHGTPRGIAALVADGTPDLDYEAEEERDRLRKRLALFRTGLTGTRAAVFDRRLLKDEPDTLESIGTSLGVTREAIRQAELKIKASLKESLVHYENEY